MLLLPPAETADSGWNTDATLAQVSVGRDCQWGHTSQPGSSFVKLLKERRTACVWDKEAALVPNFQGDTLAFGSLGALWT